MRNNIRKCVHFIVFTHVFNSSVFGDHKVTTLIPQRLKWAAHGLICMKCRTIFLMMKNQTFIDKIQTENLRVKNPNSLDKIQH